MEEENPLKLTIDTSPSQSVEETNENASSSSWTKTNTRLLWFACGITLITDITLWIIVFPSRHHHFFKDYFTYLVTYSFFGFFTFISLIPSIMQFPIKPWKEWTLWSFIGYVLGAIYSTGALHFSVFLVIAMSELIADFRTRARSTRSAPFFVYRTPTSFSGPYKTFFQRAYAHPAKISLKWVSPVPLL